MPQPKRSLTLWFVDPVNDATMAIAVHSLAQLLAPTSTATGYGDRNTKIMVHTNGTITRDDDDDDLRMVVGRWSVT